MGKRVGCQYCPLNGRPRVKTFRRENAQVLVIGEAPGRDEVPTGRPFVGAAGQKLERMFPLIKEATITNACLCWPPNNQLPQSAIKHCRAHVRTLLTEYNEVFILGATALKSVFEGGKVFREVKGSSFEEDGILYHVLYHPAASLHNPDLRSIIEKQYAAMYNEYLKRTGSTYIAPMKPKFAEYPDGFINMPRETTVIDTEWDQNGNVLIGVWTDKGVYQHVRYYSKGSMDLFTK